MNKIHDTDMLGARNTDWAGVTERRRVQVQLSSELIVVANLRIAYNVSSSDPNIPNKKVLDCIVDWSNIELQYCIQELVDQMVEQTMLSAVVVPLLAHR